MTKRPPLTVILLVIVLCFALGVLNVLLNSPDEPVSQSPTPTAPTVPDNSSNLLSVLIVGVDQLSSADPNLRSLWVALYDETGGTLYLHGVPLDSVVNGIKGTRIEDAFTWSQQEGVDPQFLSSLYSILALSPDLVVLLDDVAFASVVNFLGGVDIEGAKLDGSSVLAFLSLSWDKPEVLLNNQALILEALVPQALASAPSPELTELIALIPEHVYLSQDVTDAVALLTPLREIGSENIFFILIP